MSNFMEREVYKGMDAEERQIQEDSLRPLVLQKVSQAVIAEMRNFPGMSRADVALALTTNGKWSQVALRRLKIFIHT